MQYVANGDPIEVATEMLLEAHFELSAYVAADEEVPGRSEIENALYIMRKMYQLFHGLHPQKREIPVYLYIGESKKMAVNTLLPPPMTDTSLNMLPEGNTTDAEAVFMYGKKANA